MSVKIVQAGNPVLRKQSRFLTKEEVTSPAIQTLIEIMRETMREAPGVGLAAPQIGEPLQIAVIEDRSEYLKEMALEKRIELQRSPVPFHVIINPKLSFVDDSSAEFFEGCLSVSGYQAVVKRALKVRVDCLNERGEGITINAKGWYARILQHEIDHLNGTLYIDRMYPRTLTTAENMLLFWKNRGIEELLADLAQP